MRFLICILLALVGGTSTVLAGDSVLERLDAEIRNLAKKAAPAVVKVRVEQELALPDGIGSERQFLSRGSRIGTGFLVSDRGLVLTTQQLVKGASEARVVFPDGVIRQGQILGSDSFYKVALVKIEPVEGIAPLELASESDPQFGSLTVFLAYSYGMSRNLSLGLVTGTRVSGLPFDRFDNFLTVNARQNPGDTGGPFLDHRGRVLGMAVRGRGNLLSVFDNGTGKGGIIQSFPGMAGPAYGVPAADLAFAVGEIEAHGRVRAGRLGVNILRQSLVVKDVHEDSPAARAGMKSGDTLLAVNGAPIHTVGAFSWILRRTPVDREFSITLARGEERLTLRLTMEEFVPAALPGIALAIRAAGAIVRYVDPKHATVDVHVGDRILSVDGEVTESGDAVLAALHRVSGYPKTIDVVREGVRITLPGAPRPEPKKNVPPEKKK